MLNVQSLNTFLKSMGPEKNVQRFSLFNFINEYCRPDEVVDEELLFNYFNHIYNFTHWRENQQQLINEFSNLFTRYFRSMNSENPININERFQWQLFSFNDPKQFQLAIENYLSETYDITKVKVVPLKDNEMLSLYMLESGPIEIVVFKNQFKVVQGRLFPLEAMTHLKYNDNLELLPNIRQTVSINAHTQAHLKLTSSQSGTGSLIRGYSLQKHATLQFKSISDYPEIHQIIKRLEHHFIHPKSDPEYVDLVLMIEKSTQMLTQRDPGSEKIALSSYQKGQYAVENLFPNDKYLKLLLSQLELAIFKRGRDTLNI